MKLMLDAMTKLWMQNQSVILIQKNLWILTKNVELREDKTCETFETLTKIHVIKLSKLLQLQSSPGW